MIAINISVLIFAVLPNNYTSLVYVINSESSAVYLNHYSDKIRTFLPSLHHWTQIYDFSDQ